MPDVNEKLEEVGAIYDKLAEFVVAYGMQILGATLVLVVGLMVSSWAAKKTVAFGEKRNFDPTLCKFSGAAVRVVLITVVIIITLGNFGITIAPFVALAGAGAFGATLALQGMLSNYGAGIAIIFGRLFVVGNTIKVRDTFGVVEEIKLGQTFLVGEDGEKITIPNKQILGEILVNSDKFRVVETRLVIAHDADVDRAVSAIADTTAKFSEGFANDDSAPVAQVGIHGFGFGGIVLGIRFWVPSLEYFRTRYAVNRAVLKALETAQVQLLPTGGWPNWADPLAFGSAPLDEN